MAREGKGWLIPVIKEYYCTEDPIKRNTARSIRKNIYDKPIRGKPKRVIAQLIQIEIQNNVKKGQIPHGLQWLAIHQLLNRVKDYLWKWKEQGYSNRVNEERNNGIQVEEKR